ncbi:MAG: proline--tRNA ligase, partial [Anaerolineae bacterium]|nr:proline--tRNA ligase [Phycisphaerae bacterium]
KPTLENVTHPKWVAATVRGDHDVNEAKLRQAAKKHFQVDQIELIDNLQVREKWAIGFCGPDKAVNDVETVVLVDSDAAQGGFWATGANEVDYHVKHFNWFRECGDRLADPRKVVVADMRNAIAGDPSPKNDGGKLVTRRGIEIGHVFKLGTKYSVALDATFDDAHGQTLPIIMGCYGIGIGRILLSAVEAHHDDRGIVWPASIAPFACIITPVQYGGEVKTVADKLHDQLNAAGIDTLLDDRLDLRPGPRFADADLIGIPIRVTVGERGLKDGVVEVKGRTESDAHAVKLCDVIEFLLAKNK